MSRLFLAALLCSAVSYGGVVQGIVIENVSGRALARAVVFLTPVPGTAAAEAAKPLTVRTGRSGQFTFPGVAPGLYILTSSREGYFAASYGQRLPSGRGAPITIGADSQFFAELRMRHKGAITGRVLDENGVGTPRVPVVAYRARLPLRSAGAGVADDRGVYRVPGLEPGKYWIRSAGHTLDDGSTWLPSFAPQSHESRDAKIFPVTVDADTAYADVSPMSGLLFSVSGSVTCDHTGEVVVTLASDTGQQLARTICSTVAPGSFSFSGLPAGLYELFGTFVDNTGAAWVELNVGGNTKAELSLAPPMSVVVEYTMRGSRARAPTAGRLFARRQMMAEAGAVFEIKGNSGALAPGYWELRAQAPPGFYVHAMSGMWGGSVDRRTRSVPPSDWFELAVQPGLRSNGVIRVELGNDGGSIEGKVLQQGSPAAGVPVFLWPVAQTNRRGLGGVAETMSAADGTYRFADVPPGDYKLLATFDVSELDEELIEASQAPVLTVRPGAKTASDPTLWTAPW